MSTIDRIVVGARFFGFPAVDSWVSRRRHPRDPGLRPRPRRGRAFARSRTISRPGIGGNGSIVRPARRALGKPLVAVANPPPVQMLVPGFSTRELPVDLTNINNVRYRADGKLVALAYDGNIYLLSDADGDGVEEKVELFWENKGTSSLRSAWP